MTISTPLDLATDGRDAMIAIGMNGEPLPREHGFPARMVVPGLYGFVSASKWITRMTLTTYAEQDAYWTQRDWADRRPDQDLQPHRHPQAAVDRRRRAHRHRRRRLGPAPGGIDKVEVRVDGGALAAGAARPERRPGLLAPVVPRLGRRAGPALARGAARPTATATSDGRPGHAVPRRLQRHPGDRRHRPLTRAWHEPRRFHGIRPIRPCPRTEHQM